MKPETVAYFWQGPYQKLYLLERTVPCAKQVVIFAPPLFEDANTIRHAYTKLAIALQQKRVSSLIFDYSGTGDSLGCLTQTHLAQWQQELEQLCQYVKTRTNNTQLTLLSCHSASLLLTPTLLTLADQNILWHPEIIGKKYVKQLKRMALAQQQNQKADHEHCQLIAGYEIPTELLNEICTLPLSDMQCDDTYWFELCLDDAINVGRAKYLADMQNKQGFSYQQIKAEKFWQSTELLVPEDLIKATIQVFNDKRHG